MQYTGKGLEAYFLCARLRDVISETESDNQQRQITQQAHRVFRSRRHISEDLENEHVEPRDMDDVRDTHAQTHIHRKRPMVKHNSSLPSLGSQSLRRTPAILLQAPPPRWQ